MDSFIALVGNFNHIHFIILLFLLFQLKFNCSKLIETLGEGVKYVQT